MSLIQESSTLLLEHDICKKWPEIGEAIKRSTSREPFSWKLPSVACEAVAGIQKDIYPALAAFSCLHISIRLIDDLLDEDQRLESVGGNLARTANVAIAFQALCADFLLSNKDDPLAIEAVRELSKMQLYLAFGQDLDVQNIGTEESYWEIARAKSGIYFAAALYLGALYGGADNELAHKIREFGLVYGEIMQIHDDLNDTLDENPGPDWLEGRQPLPILFSETVDHPQRERFLILRQSIEEDGALKEAQNILINCGAISYAINELMLRHNIAKNLLDDMPLANPVPLELLLVELMEPVELLFEKLGK